MEAMKRVCSLSWPPMRPPSTFFFLLLVGSFLPVSAFARDTILPGEGISGNQTLVSKNGLFELGFFSSEGNMHHFVGVRIQNMPASFGSRIFWFGERVYISDLPSAELKLYGDLLYIMEAANTLWSSSVAGGGPAPAAAVAVLLDSGNFVVREQANSSRILWQSFDCPADKLLPGERLGFDRETGTTNVSLTYTTLSSMTASLSVDQSRKNGFVLTTVGVDVLRGTFPDWLVSSQDNGSSLVLSSYPQSRAQDLPKRTPAEQFLTLVALGAPLIIVPLAAQSAFRGFRDARTLYAVGKEFQWRRMRYACKCGQQFLCSMMLQPLLASSAKLLEWNLH